MLKLILPAIHLFGLVGFILYKTRSPFFRFMKDRQREISDGLNRSKTQASAAAERKKEIEAKLATLESEKVLIAKEWEEKRLKQVQVIQESAARVIAQTRREAEQNRVALEASVASEALVGFRRAVLVRAMEKIRGSLSAEVQARLQKQFLNEISGGGAR
jgi:F0F1-type ATP synthase membrane subunit b/b'